MKQWHPLFAQLLRPLVEGYFKVEINVAVGDVPREADLVLLQRIIPGNLPFRGLWKHLTRWNVLEYKGPTVSARFGDLDLLVELGLGIHRRLNEQRGKDGQSKLEPGDMSWWLLTHQLGKRFLRVAKQHYDGLEAVEDGVWRFRILQRLVYLVSAAHLPLSRDALPFHLLDWESPANELEAAKLVVSEPGLWQIYGSWVMSLPAAVLEELRQMAKTIKGPSDIINLEPLVELLGLEEVINKLGTKRIINKIGVDRILALLTPEQRDEAKRRLSKK